VQDLSILLKILRMNNHTLVLHRRILCHSVAEKWSHHPLRVNVQISFLKVKNSFSYFSCTSSLTLERRGGRFVSDEWHGIKLFRTKVQLFIFKIHFGKGRSSIVVWLPMTTFAILEATDSHGNRKGGFRGSPVRRLRVNHASKL